MRLFFETFWIAPKGPPFICFDILKHNGCQKIPKGPSFYIFRHCDTVQKSHFKIFLGNFFQSLKGPRFIFFHILQPAGVSQSPKGPPFYIFRHCDTVQFIFSYFATSWSFTKPKESPLLQFWALDIAPTLAVLGLFFIVETSITALAINHSLQMITDDQPKTHRWTTEVASAAFVVETVGPLEETVHVSY